MIKVGIAGYGVVGKKRHLALMDSGRADVVAVCDKASSNLNLLDKKLTYYDNYRDLLDEDLDAIFVCMTNDMATEVTLAALDKNLHVFCEKPPARSPSELHQVSEFVHEYKRETLPVLMYGFNHRYHDSVEKAKSLIDSGEFGTIVSMRGLYGKSKLITFDQSDWRTKRSVAGGGVLLDQGIHLVDLMTLFGGEFSEFKSHVSSSFWGFDVEDNVFALMKSDKGIVASLVSSAIQWQHKFELEITLTEGLIKLSGLLTGSKSYGEEKIHFAKVDHTNNNGNLIETAVKYNSDNSWQKEVIHFLDCVASGEQPSSGTLEDAERTLHHVFNIYKADKDWKQKHNIED